MIYRARLSRLSRISSVLGLLPDHIVGFWIRPLSLKKYCPDIINNTAVDIIARGEAELSFSDLITKIENGQDYADAVGFWVRIGGKTYRNDIAPLLEDVSSLTYPDHELYLKYRFFKEQTEVPFLMTRG